MDLYVAKKPCGHAVAAETANKTQFTAEKIGWWIIDGLTVEKITNVKSYSIKGCDCDKPTEEKA